MTEQRKPFDWPDLEGRFRAATALPGVAPDDPNWWGQWRRHVASRKTPVWFYSRKNLGVWLDANWPALAGRWRTAAEEVRDDPVMGTFRPERLPNGDFDWERNPSRDMNWAGMHYWSWVNPIIRGYGLTGDARFVETFAAHLRSYFEQVDVFVPQLWAGANAGDRDWRDWITHNELSAGIKMANFAEAAMVFAQADAWGADDLRRATLLMLRLAERLYETYRNGRTAAEILRPLNFLTSGAAGLGVVAAIFPECRWSVAWRDLAVRILEIHLMELYYGDGGHKELCTQYHKTGIRDVLFFERVLAAQGENCFLSREPYRTRLLGALRWLTGILMPDGTTAVLNSAAASTDWLVYGLVANKAIEDPELNWHLTRWFSPGYVPRQKAIPADCARILGEGDVPAGPVLKPDRCSVLFPESGVAVLRNGWDRWASVMALDFGRPVGGHAYPARGSFSLYLNGKPAALSPGSPHSYTDPDYRGWMHTSRSQNNVLIDDLDQNQWEMPGLRRVHGEILRWEADADSALVQGRHPGYLAEAGIVHTRAVKMVRDIFLVYDVLDASLAEEDRVAKWSIHCPLLLEAHEGHRVVAKGLMCISPAWPARISRVAFGREGKAVLPADSADGRTDAHQALYHARWHQPLHAGQRCEFLMAIAPDGCGVEIVDVSRISGELLVTVQAHGAVDAVRLPLAKER